MKKKGFLAIIGCIIVVGIVVFAFSGRKPYNDLKASDILSAVVHLAPPDQTIQITEIKELVAHLNEIIVYREDRSYTEYCGQAVLFTLTMADGSKEEVLACNPFILVNGTRYHAKYKPCEKLNRYGNTLLEQAE